MAFVATAKQNVQAVAHIAIMNTTKKVKHIVLNFFYFLIANYLQTLRAKFTSFPSPTSTSLWISATN